MTRPDIQRFDHAVLITPATAQTLVAALRAMEQLYRTRGARLTPALRSIVAQLDEAAAPAESPTGAPTDVDASTPVPRGAWLPLSAHDLLTADEAADLLGCTPNNVRDLARRGALPAHRSGGRWLLEREGVQLRAG